jgi:hypothetical protein
MKRLTIPALALALFAVGCDEVLNPVAPTPGTVNLVSQVSGAQVVPPAGSLEAAAAGTLQVTMSPTTGGAYTASFTFSIGGLVRAGILPTPLDSGSVIVAGLVSQAAAGSPGAPVLQLPISQAAPIVTPTGTVLLTFTGVAVPSAVASAILANPSGFYFSLHSALNQAGVVRGQLIKQ